MKILSGQHRGRAISFKPNQYLRPTSDKVRMALINSLQSKIASGVILDIFAGTGAVGFEFLSSGASRVVFIEKNKFQYRSILKNLDNLNLKASSEVFCGDAFDCLNQLTSSKSSFDIIFADPPYEKGMGQRVLDVVSKSPILTSGGILAIEVRRQETCATQDDSLTLIKRRVYGDTELLYFSKT